MSGIGQRETNTKKVDSAPYLRSIMMPTPAIFIFAVFCILISCSGGGPDDSMIDPIVPKDTLVMPIDTVPIDTVPILPIDTVPTLTDKLAGLYKGKCFDYTYNFNVMTGITYHLYDTVDFEVRLLNVDTVLIKVEEKPPIFEDEFYNSSPGQSLSDTMVYYTNSGLDRLYWLTIYPYMEKLAFRMVNDQPGPYRMTRNCPCMER